MSVSDPSRRAINFLRMPCLFPNRQNRLQRYLEALEREATASRDTLADPQFMRLTIGGGKPTQLTQAGLDWSDSIGPWLCSRHMRTRMEHYQWR